MSGTLDFFFEFASTYSYPAALRIGAVAHTAGVTVRWRPFLLGPIFRTQGYDTSPFNVHEAKGRYMWRDLARTCAAGRTLGIEVQSLEVRAPDDFDGAFEAARRERPDALITVEDPLTFSHRQRVADFTAEQRLPSLHGLREFAAAGGLLSYGANLVDLFRRAAGYVDKILRGAKPADLPVQQPTKFELVINLKTAKALGLEVPATLLARADEVIE